MKKIIAVTAALVLMLTLAGCSNNDAASAEKEARAAESYNTVEEGGLSFQFPDYFGEPEMSGDVKNYYAETGKGTTMLQINSIDGILDEDDLESDCQEVYDAYATGIKESEDITDFREGSSEPVTLDCGLHGMEYKYSFKMSDIGCNATVTLINNTESDKVVFVSIIQSDQSEYDYADAYTELVDTCEITGGKSEPSGTAETSDSEDNSADADSSDNASAGGAADDSGTSDSGDDSSSADSGEISPDFKKTMDDYEAWFDHYCEVMKKYSENPSDLELMSEMTDLLAEETTMLEQMENMDQSEMNTAELAYYIEVTARIEKKLLEVANY